MRIDPRAEEAHTGLRVARGSAVANDGGPVVDDQLDDRVVHDRVHAHHAFRTLAKQQRSLEDAPTLRSRIDRHVAVGIGAGVLAID